LQVVLVLVSALLLLLLLLLIRCNCICMARRRGRTRGCSSVGCADHRPRIQLQEALNVREHEL
jgi:hypothetical protein